MNIFKLPMHVIYFQSTSGALLETMIHISSVFWTYAFYKSKLYYKILIGIVSLLFCFWISIKGYDMWLHKLNHGTFTGYTQEKEIQNFQFMNEKDDTIAKQNFLGKYVIFDFWNRYCGVCFQKFPKVEKLYETITPYKDRIELYAVNLKYAEDTESYAFETIREKGYSFPVLRTMDGDMLQTVFGVNGYPTVVILDTSGNLIFRGNIENATKFVKKKIIGGLSF